jgi:hypothetical protein
MISSWVALVELTLHDGRRVTIVTEYISSYVAHKIDFDMTTVNIDGTEVNVKESYEVVSKRLRGDPS